MEAQFEESKKLESAICQQLARLEMENSDWELYTLGDLTENFDSIRIPVKETDRKKGQYPYYGASGIIDMVDDYLFDGEYLLVAEDGENLRSRKTPIAFIASGKFWVNNHAHIIRGNDKANTRFLMYCLSQTDISGFLTGSTLPKLTQDNLNRIPIYAPPLPEQRAIAGILGALDDKIELNRRMNRTLESMARAVFRQWFVEGEEIENWKVGKLGDIADVNWGDTNTTKSSYVENGYPAYSAKGQDGFLPYYDFDRTGVVVSAIGANSGATWLALGKWSCIKNTLRFWATSDEISTEYLFYATFGNEKWPLRGSAQPFIAQGDAREMKIVLPPNKLAIKFAEIIRPLIEMQKHNEKESHTLASLRDALLPKLMRGEVRVKV